jgi:hypothetical protein
VEAASVNAYERRIRTLEELMGAAKPPPDPEAERRRREREARIEALLRELFETMATEHVAAVNEATWAMLQGEQPADGPRRLLDVVWELARDRLRGRDNFRLALPPAVAAVYLEGRGTRSHSAGLACWCCHMRPSTGAAACRCSTSRPTCRSRPARPAAARSGCGTSGASGPAGRWSDRRKSPAPAAARIGEVLKGARRMHATKDQPYDRGGQEEPAGRPDPADMRAVLECPAALEAQLGAGRRRTA